MNPAVIAGSISGLLIVVAIILLIHEYRISYNDNNKKEIDKDEKKLDNVTLIQIVIGLSIALGSYGLSRLLEESYYYFNPINK